MPIPPPIGGRTTRTAQKAAKPLTPKIVPPTHPKQPYQSPVLEDPPTQPVQLSPSFSLPNLNLPTISQLRDYPNLTAPVHPSHPSVIVTLPQSAPSSPIPTHYSNFDTSVQAGDPVTPSTSPAQVSVILSNPSFLPLPPSLPPRFSTPAGSQAGGSWDNFLEDPTYQEFDQEFWKTRGSWQIQLVSTDISEPEDLSELGSSGVYTNTVQRTSSSFIA